MDNDNTPPSCLVYFLILSGIFLALGAALLMSQTDALQQRTFLPQATVPVVDFEATLAASDLTVVVIPGEGLKGPRNSTPPSTSTLTPPEVEEAAGVEATKEETPEPSSTPLLLPTCAAWPDGWVPYHVKANDSLRSLSIQLGIDEDSLALANCLLQPQLKTGQIIYLPSAPEDAAETP